MVKQILPTTTSLAELIVQLGDETRRDFTCSLYDDGYAEVPGSGYRIRRIPRDIASKFKVSAPVGQLYLFTKFASEKELSYIGATAGVSEFPVQAEKKTVAAIKNEMDRRYLDGLASAFCDAGTADHAEISDPATLTTWVAQRIDCGPGLEALHEDGRTPYVAHDGRGLFFIFDVLSDGSTEVMVGTDDETAEIIFNQLQVNLAALEPASGS